MAGKLNKFLKNIGFAEDEEFDDEDEFEFEDDMRTRSKSRHPYIPSASPRRRLPGLMWSAYPQQPSRRS